MSFTLGVQPWFQRASVGADLAHHAREFGITFVDDQCSGNNNNNIKSVPGLIPIGRKRRRSSDVTCDSAGGRVSGSVVMIEGDNQDDAKLLRLFGGGDSDSGVSVNSVLAADGTNVCGESVHGDNSGGQSRCSVVLDPLPTDLLRSLTTDGRISAEKATKTCQQTHEWEDSLPMISDNEVQGLLQNLVEEGEDSEPTLARCQRQESLLQPPSLRDDAIDYDVRDEGSRDSTVAPQGVKVRQRKSEAPRKAVRRRRERHSSSDGRKKRRKRSTSCSTTSSTCSTSSHPHQHRHHHKHKHRHRTPSPPPRARVNPIFVWVKQDDTRIVEVLCEDYDKRNRIRLTKTPHGWRAIPRTERLSSMPASSAETVLDGSASGTEACREAELETGELTEAPTEGSSMDHNITSLVPEDDELHDDDDDETLSQQTKDEFEDETLLELEPSGIDTIIENMLSPTTEDCDGDQHDYQDELDRDESDSENEEAIELNNKATIESTERAESVDVADECNHASVPEHEEGVASLDLTCSDHPVQSLATDINEKVVIAAEEIPPSVERDGKQVVQKDNIVLDESATKLLPVDTTIPNLPAIEELVPTDLSLPKTNDDKRQPPKVAFARSISSILRAPRTVTPNSPLPLTSPISRASPRLGISPALPEPAATSEVSPAHQTKQQQQKSMFLESLLSSPRKCHQITKSTLENEPAPLDLGKSSVRCSGSPTITCSEEVKKSDPDEPKPKCLKLEDITLKSLLSRQTEGKKAVKEENVDARITKGQEARKTSTSESTKSRKSRLLELLTSEPTNSAVTPDLDPLTQLKKILSDPDLAIPDPLLVPRDRLHDLVSCPAKEIPRLLTLRPELRLPEALAYPSLLQDPNLLVVSIAYLQNLLRNPDKPVKESESYSSLGAFLEWQRYQSQQMQAVELLEAQLKQQASLASGRDLDPGSAQALNQMMWLPYLNQLEATAMACGNNQEFLNVLNAVFPTGYGNGGCGGGGPPFSPGMAVSPGFPMSADYKTQLELQQTFSMWQELMAQAATSTQPVNNNMKNGLNAKTPHPCIGNKMMPNRPSNMTKKNFTSARTSPITPNFHPQSRGSVPNGHHQYPPLVPGGLQSHHQYNQHQSRPRPQPTQQTSVPTKQPKLEVPSGTTEQQGSKPHASRPTVTCKSLRNLLSSPRREESPSQILASFSSKAAATAHEMTTTTTTPKLKVKQHLIDPTIKPKLLKHEIKPEVAASAEERVSPPQLHPHLWHPLFGSQKTSYNSPWQWTTVTVNGE